MSTSAHSRTDPLGGFDFVLGATACLVVWLVFLPFATLDIDPHHDGTMLKPALDVVSGQTLFRDTFMPYGALTTWLQAAALAAFGPSLRVLRLATVFVYGLIAGALVIGWRLVLPRTLALAAWAIWFLLSPIEVAVQPWSSVYALCFQAMAMLALMGAVGRRSSAWAFASGVLAALTFLSRQFPTGLFTCSGVLGAFVALGVCFPDWRRRAVAHLGIAGVGMLLVVGIFLVHVTLHGSRGAWWQQTVMWPVAWSESLRPDGIFASLQRLDRWWRLGLVFTAVAAIPLVLVRRGGRLASAIAIAGAAIGGAASARLVNPYVLVHGASGIGLALAAGATVYAALRTRGAPSPETAMALAALVVCLGSWTQAYPLGDPAHLFWALSPSYGFSLLAAWELGGRRTSLVAAVLLLLCAPLAIVKASKLKGHLTWPRVTLVSPPLLAGMRERASRAADWNGLSNAIRDYSRMRPSWPMLLEGDNMVLLGMAPDLQNADPVFARTHLQPYDPGRRALFIMRKRPVVFRQLPPEESVAYAMKSIGYDVLFRTRKGELLLAPRLEMRRTSQ